MTSKLECVTKMIGIFHSLKVRLINFIPSPLVASSRLENGSSNKIKSGFVLSVRAKATR